MNKILMNEVIDGIRFDKLKDNVINVLRNERKVIYLDSSDFSNYEFNLEENAYLEINKIYNLGEVKQIFSNRRIAMHIMNTQFLPFTQIYFFHIQRKKWWKQHFLFIPFCIFSLQNLLIIYIWAILRNLNFQKNYLILFGKIGSIRSLTARHKRLRMPFLIRT